MAANSTRRRRERGAGLLEAAIVMPVFFMMLMALFEMGLAVHNHVKVDGAVTAAVRAVTVDGASLDADYVTMQTLRHGLTTFDVTDIESIVIFRADGPGGEMPAACRSIPIPVGAPCNGYHPSDFFLPFLDPSGTQTGDWGCSSYSRDSNWCPTGRQDGISDPGGPDHVGVYVRVRVPTITGMFGAERTVEITHVGRIEPASN